MLILDDLMLGILASAFVAYADRLDAEEAEENAARAAKLRETAELLRSPTDAAQGLLNRSFRDHNAGGRPIARLAEVIGGDPLWGERLVRWMLESDPEQARRSRLELVAELERVARCPREDLDRFLQKLYQRVSSHPDLGPLRTDARLSRVLVQLDELVDLQAAARQHQVYLAAEIRRFLDRDQLRSLVPVCPRFRPISESNRLLHGDRPSDEDMDQDLDFRRTKFPEVLRDVSQIEELPAAFVFLADPHQGKTTFLMRLGWELAERGYRVVRLDPAFRGEPYGIWLAETADELTGQPLVALIDDPLVDRDHFQAQMISLTDRKAQVVCLIASRHSDWAQIEVKRVPSLNAAKSFVLDPNALEGRMALKKLIKAGFVNIDPQHLEEVQEEIARQPFGESYFHKVIEVACDHRFKPTPVLVEESLAKAGGSAEAEAFEHLYGFVCLFGMVGLPLPQQAAQCLMLEGERWKAHEFSKSIANPPIRWEQDALLATHETHAVTFFKGRDIGACLRQVVESSLTEPKLRSSAGSLLDMLRRRGHAELALDTWARIADRVQDDYWLQCEAESLTYSWGSFFYHGKLSELALQVNEAALQVAKATTTSIEVVASALGNKGVSLGALERHQEEIAVYDQVEERYAERDELQLAEQVARALVNKGARLGALERHQEAIAVYDQVEERYAERDELQLAEQVAWALVNKGSALSQLGSRKRPGSDDQQKTWHQAETTLRIYAERSGRPIERVYNYACLLALSQEVAHALEALEECLKDPPTITVDHVRQDPDWEAFHSLPDFRALLKRHE